MFLGMFMSVLAFYLDKKESSNEEFIYSS